MVKSGGVIGGSYTFGPYSIVGHEGSELVIMINDAEDAGCGTVIRVDTPEESCSPACILVPVEIGTPICSGDETNSALDDAFTFVIRVSGTNVGGNTWRAVDQFGTEYSGLYNQNRYIGPYSYADHAGTAITLIITDVTNPTCGSSTMVLEVPSESCSQVSILLDLYTVTCDDNGTNWDSSG
ncbi:MAG: hypothetical protein R2795_05575 [Saprospiraceae bacterium]